jgi:alginate O-acetyltransferase complex protein AlgI
MLFNSLQFLAFFPIVVLLFYALPHRLRWVILLLASYYFYMAWKPEYALLLVLSTVVDYICGYRMSITEDKQKRKPFLYLSLLSNLGILFTFKYLNFFNDSAKGLAEVLGMNYAVPAFELLLPMGISFYTFQTMSYSIDVYKGEINAEKHFGRFALFVTFFPQLVAGPIERAKNLLPQFKKEIKFDFNNVLSGARLILWGLFKKIVIADRLAYLVNEVYNNPYQYDSLTLLIGTIFFAFQIYCDFSGYSDIAIGCARVIGFDLMKNFNAPYFSKSISEFWSRWHISLSQWFKDYLYIPLGGNRVIKWRWYYNLVIVFLVSGVWHGANWTFIMWGLLHGFYQIIEVSTKRMRGKILPEGLIINKLKVVMTFSLVCLAWVFFRANTVTEAFNIIFKLFDFERYNFRGFYNLLLSLQGYSVFEFAISFLFIILLLIIESLVLSGFHRSRFIKNPLVSYSVYYSFIFIVILFGIFSDNNQFIYFQF